MKKINIGGIAVLLLVCTGCTKTQAPAPVPEVTSVSENVKETVSVTAQIQTKKSTATEEVAKPQTVAITKVQNSEQIIWPVGTQYSTITFEYGKRVNPENENDFYFHNGTDIWGENIANSEIYAVLSGTVTDTGFSDEDGNFVELTHQNGMVTRYCNCADIAVNKGDSVSQGNVIAYVGNSGLSTAEHLHFEILIDGEYINPMSCYKK